MTELETALADNRAAVDEFVETARGFEATTWTASRGDGRWSPGQVVEHLARAYEYNRAVIRGTAEGLPFPLTLLKPLIRRLVVTNTLTAGRFTRKGKAPKPFQPGPTPAPQPELVTRLTAAVTGFEADLRSRPRSDTIEHPVFGTISTTDWVKLQAIHARHHRAQLTSSTSGRD